MQTVANLNRGRNYLISVGKQKKFDFWTISVVFREVQKSSFSEKSRNRCSSSIWARCITATSASKFCFEARQCAVSKICWVCYSVRQRAKFELLSHFHLFLVFILLFLSAVHLAIHWSTEYQFAQQIRRCGPQHAKAHHLGSFPWKFHGWCYEVLKSRLSRGVGWNKE